MKPAFTIAFLAILVFVPQAFAQYEIVNAFPNLFFTRPVDIQHAGDGTNRLFVVEQDGRINVFPNDPDVQSSEVFLDITSKVLRSGNEEGLLGLAFHPNYENNGYFYVNHSIRMGGNQRWNRIARYTVSGNDPNVANPNSEHIILEFRQPFSNHNGGSLAFGPDGYLYIATGDGGSGGDPEGNGQKLTTLLGKILRIDIDNAQDGNNYAIPSTNPFAGSLSVANEIWAYGLRNPWRMSFDPVTGWLWAGDVGQGKFEEIDIIESGKNYGWNIMEGFACFNPSSGCDTSGLAKPVIDYPRSEGVSVTGGYVYRGSKIPELYGAYVYGDFGSGNIWTLRYDGSSTPDNQKFNHNQDLTIATFGVDEEGELYLSHFGGSIHKFVSTSTSNANVESTPLGYSINVVYPNPYDISRNSTVTVQINNVRNGYGSLKLIDQIGRTVQYIHDDKLPTGKKNLSFTPRTTASGLYHIVYTTPDGTRISKPLVIR